MTPARAVPYVMLLIDADNVNVEVIEQALQLVIERHGAAHVRRAWCTAELALKQVKLFKALSIRPMVNVSTGKNSTDIALAVDAMELVASERPDIVVLVSSDSDFAPLVIRLREKGCRVEGIGQLGKTGDESKPVYDDFVDLPHHAASRTARPVATAKQTETTTPAKRAAKSRSSRSSSRATGAAADSAARAASPPPAPAAPAPATAPAPAPAPVRAQQTRGRRSARPTDAGSPSAAAPAEVERMLDALPELRAGARMQLNQAKQGLLDAGLLARSAPSTKLFRKYPELFELTPERTPNKVRYLAPEER